MLATIAAILDAPLTAGQAEDSFNVLRTFTEKEAGPPVRDHVIVQAADATYAIRAGDWKLVERVDAPHFEHRNRKGAAKAAKRKKAAAGGDELFNLNTDPAEARSVIVDNKQRAAELKMLLTAGRDNGFTRPNPARE
jgi:hypothetical protein